MGYGSLPPSRRRYSFKGGTCTTPVETFPSIHLPLLSTATFILFVLMCYLSTPHTLQRLSIYHPSAFAHLRGPNVELDTGIILASRHPSLGSDKSGHRSSSHEQVLGLVSRKPSVGTTIHPDIKLVEITEPEEKTNDHLWFKAEYSIEIPLCDLERDLENSDNVRACTQDSGAEVRIPASESLRVSFCTGLNFRKHVKLAEGGEQYGINNSGGRSVWDDDQTWDYVFPPIDGQKDNDATGGWLWNVEGRPLEKWITMDIPGRSHNASLRTHMTFPMDAPTGGNGTKPQWQFLLTTAGVSINADAREIVEEEVFVDRAVAVPMAGVVGSQETLPSVTGPVTGVKNIRAEMWRWKGRFGGCPGEGERILVQQPGDDQYVE